MQVFNKKLHCSYIHCGIFPKVASAGQYSSKERISPLRNYKRLKISYDWRGMPIEFTQYPPQENTGVSGDTLYKMAMAYDGSGRRISKTRWVKARGEAGWSRRHVTHYTGIGTEVRENFAGESPETKVVVNMPVFFRVTLTRLKPRSYIEKDILRLSNGGAILPKQSFGASRQGLGRYGIEDADRMAEDGTAQTFEWFLKNHLGSTMLVYGTGGTSGGLKAAYDYRSFGEQVTLTESADKVTENFTGKELDDETQLDYFGARYLDPMLGVWISVDPMRQFASPYLYAGNGFNPVNVVDPDGNTAYMSVDKNNVITYMMFDIDDNNTVEVTWGNGDISTFNGPDYDSYFYSLGSDGFPNIIGQKFDVNMELNARTMLNDVNPLAIWRWFSNKQYDFKYRYYGSGDVTNSVGVLNGTIMTARDVGNAIWAGYTRYMYLCRLGCNSPASIQNAYGAMVDIADFVAGGQEDRASASMQFWGFHNFKP